MYLNGTDPVVVQWNYKIVCHPLKDDLKLNRLHAVDDIHIRMAMGGVTMEEYEKTRSARFQVRIWFKTRQRLIIMVISDPCCTYLNTGMLFIYCCVTLSTLTQHGQIVNKSIVLHVCYPCRPVAGCILSIVNLEIVITARFFDWYIYIFIWVLKYFELSWHCDNFGDSF